MSDHETTHATFTLERTYPAAPARVFAAWADPALKARWFAATDGFELDFRVGGRETTRGRPAGGPLLTFTSTFHDIVDGERIVFTSTMSADDRAPGQEIVTVSITTVELTAEGQGTRLVLTQQGTYLDGREEPAWREQGTGDQLDALGGVL